MSKLDSHDISPDISTKFAALNLEEQVRMEIAAIELEDRVVELEGRWDAMWHRGEGWYPGDACGEQRMLGPLCEHGRMKEWWVEPLSAPRQRFDWDDYSVSQSGQGSTGGDAHQQTPEDTAVARLDAK